MVKKPRLYSQDFKLRLCFFLGESDLGPYEIFSTKTMKNLKTNHFMQKRSHKYANKYILTHLCFSLCFKKQFLKYM